jgi:hypothetical protein
MFFHWSFRDGREAPSASSHAISNANASELFTASLEMVLIVDCFKEMMKLAMDAIWLQ